MPDNVIDDAVAISDKDKTLPPRKKTITKTAPAVAPSAWPSATWETHVQAVHVKAQLQESTQWEIGDELLAAIPMVGSGHDANLQVLLQRFSDDLRAKGTDRAPGTLRNMRECSAAYANESRDSFKSWKAAYYLRNLPDRVDLAKNHPFTSREAEEFARIRQWRSDLSIEGYFSFTEMRALFHVLIPTFEEMPHQVHFAPKLEIRTQKELADVIKEAFRILDWIAAWKRACLADLNIEEGTIIEDGDRNLYPPELREIWVSFDEKADSIKWTVGDLLVEMFPVGDNDKEA